MLYGNKHPGANPRQRMNPPALATDAFIDFVIYRCPVRGKTCLALEDKYGRWWTGVTWTYGADELGTEGRAIAYGSESDNLQYLEFNGSINNLHRSVLTLFGHINDKHTSEIFSDYLKWGSIDGGWLSVDIINNKDRYNEWRVEWEQLFDLDFPRPEGAILSSHEISIRSAKLRHSIGCRARIRHDRNSQEEKNYRWAGITQRAL